MTLKSLKSVQKTLGLLLMFFSITMLTPVAVALIYQEQNIAPFLYSFFATLFFGGLLWLPSKNASAEIRLREGFMIVVLFWVVLSSFGAVPFLFLPELNISFTNAIFESTSGLTTTGATILSGLDELPRSILFYRQQLQWLGGLGIVVLAVALLPILGIGGMQMYRAESSAIKETKFTPRQAETAKALGAIYLLLTLLCALCYRLAGMDGFDAVCHAFTTIAIGGFSTHDASFGFFSSYTAVYWVASVFMLLAGVNFSLHFFAWKNKSFAGYFKNSEFKTYFALMMVAVLIVSGTLFFSASTSTAQGGATETFFQVVSIGTTTGFTTANYGAWPLILPFFLLLFSLVGGCVGSTGGGLKVVRWLVLFKEIRREVLRLIHPRAEILIKINKHSVDQAVLDSIWGFIAAYIVLHLTMVCLLLATGLDVVTSLSAITASLNNLGPGLGDVFANYNSIGSFSKWVCIAAMLLGRLEIFALLIIFTRAFWQD